MVNQMLFPDTVEEFMEQYKIVDTEQIYTNGAEMVPIFRMKQWFEHKPERKTGKWIQDPKSKRYRCDQCLSFALKTDDMQENLSDFCPVCGAMIKGEQP